MNPEEMYQNLRTFMDSLPTGFPETESGVEIAILKKLFTQEQAELFMQLTPTPETVTQIAGRAGMDAAALEPKIEEMAQKGLLFRVRENGRILYQVFHFLVGIYEFQLNTIDKELAEMVEEYLPHFGMALVGAGVKTKQLRVAPVTSALDAASPVATYNQIRDLVAEQELISVQNCICRKEQGLLGNPCEHPGETCFSFGKFAQYYIDNNMGRKVDREETYRILDMAEASGLVLSPSNTRDISFICCCCSCCCPTIRYAKFFPKPARSFKTYYQSIIDPELCTACQDCFERCPMEAIVEGQAASEIDTGRCIGCGLCVAACPEEAISLKPLAEAQAPPEFIEDTFEQIQLERQA